jgi:hypothetical protein
VSPEPIPAERLAAIRRGDVDALFPAAAGWSLRTRMEAGRWVQLLRPVLAELLDEIAALDDDLDDAEAELAELTADQDTPTVLPAGAVTSVRVAPLPLGGKWRTYWRDADGVQHQQTHPTPREARAHATALRSISTPEVAR